MILLNAVFDQCEEEIENHRTRLINAYMMINISVKIWPIYSNYLIKLRTHVYCISFGSTVDQIYIAFITRSVEQIEEEAHRDS